MGSISQGPAFGGGGGGVSGGGLPVYNPPLAASLPTAYGAGGSIVDNSTAGAILSAAYSSTDIIVGQVRTPPTTNFTVTARIRSALAQPNTVGNKYPSAGLILADGSGKSILFARVNDIRTIGAQQIKVDHFTNTTTFSAESFAGSDPGNEWLRITYDGTNFNYYVSADGQNFSLLLTEAKTFLAAFGTTPQVGLGMDTISNLTVGNAVLSCPNLTFS